MRIDPRKCVAGRGTEEVTGRVRRGEAGFTVEFGRPGIGARFRDIDRMTRALAAAGAHFEQANGVFNLVRAERLLEAARAGR